MTKKLKDYTWDRNSTGAIQLNSQSVSQIKNVLDDTGPGFCLAKFTQVTMHLGTGMVHSCHHPSPHKIPLEEIQKDYRALFNTSALRTARRKMIFQKERPKECEYCWRVEDSGGNSDRQYKSLEPWAIENYDTIAEYEDNQMIAPTYLEVSFSNACNMKCIYCGPEFSSSWVDDLKTKGPIKLLEGTSSEQWAQGWQDLDTLNFKNREFNPYIDAFWKWFPEVYTGLKHYRITGGEPLLSKETFKSIQWFIDNPNPNLEFSINSNFMVPDKLWDKFVDSIQVLAQGDNVKKLTIYTSVEAWGKRAEYLRPGLDFELFRKRYEQILALGNVRCVIMSAFNVLSISSMEQLLTWVYEMKIKYNPNKSLTYIETNRGYASKNKSLAHMDNLNPSHSVICGIDIPYLRSPDYLDAIISTDDLVEDYFIPSLDYMSQHSADPAWADHQGFESYEIDKYKRILLKRLHDRKKGDTERRDHFDLLIPRAKFVEYVYDLDRRNGTKFIDVFPELKEFYNECVRARDTYLKWDNVDKSSD